MGRAALYIVGYAATGLVVWAALTFHTRPDDGLAWMRLVIFLAMGPSLARYAVQIVVAPFYELIMGTRRRRRLREHPESIGAPTVSVLVPAWNEEVGIEATVRSILDSHYPPHALEVVVVDDGSTDGTQSMLEQLVRDHRASGSPARLISYRQENAGKSRAMNRALELSTGEIIITIDADSVVDPDALAAFVEHYENPDVMSVAGNVKIGNWKSGVGLVQQLEYLYAFFFKKADSILNAIYIVGGAAASYRRSIVERLGPFDETIITEDIEYSTRIQDAGAHVEYAAAAVIWTEGAATVRGLAKQRLRWKYGRLMTFWRYRHLFFSVRRHHSKFLTLLVLPVALIGDLLLLLEPFLLTFVAWYTISRRDFVPLGIYIGLLGALLLFQVLTDVRRCENLNLLTLVPCVWIVIYIVDAIEFQAMIRSLYRLATGKALSWQRWQRAGVFDGTAAALPGAVADPAPGSQAEEAGHQPIRARRALPDGGSSDNTD